MDITHIDDDTIRYTYWSLDEFADELRDLYDSLDYNDRRSLNDKSHNFTHVYNFGEAVELSKYGWNDGLTEAMPIAESALDTIEQDVESIALEPLWDVAGGEVDIGRFVQGVPENMVDYELNPVSKVGKVVTLCASTVYSGALSKRSVLKRGAAITGLALALEKTGHETELWADMSCTARWGGPERLETRVLVKGTNDVVDPERIAFAYAHPAFLRQLLFCDWLRAPQRWRRKLIIPGSYGMPAAPKRDLPDGTIYLPELKTNRDVENPQRLILNTLAELGLTKENEA